MPTLDTNILSPFKLSVVKHIGAMIALDPNTFRDVALVFIAARTNTRRYELFEPAHAPAASRRFIVVVVLFFVAHIISSLLNVSPQD